MSYCSTRYIPKVGDPREDAIVIVGPIYVAGSCCVALNVIAKATMNEDFSLSKYESLFLRHQPSKSIALLIIAFQANVTTYGRLFSSISHSVFHIYLFFFAPVSSEIV